MAPLVPGISYPITGGISGPLTLADNQSSPATLLAYAWGSAKNVRIEYSISRTTVSGTNDEAGRLLISTDGTNVNITRDSEYTNNPGIVFSAIVSGSNIDVQYTSTSTGYSAEFFYSKLILD
jgi:hypothetical protein